MKTTNHILYPAIYFGLSTLITGWFIAVAPMYISQRQMYLSGVIAGSKWALQIIAGLLALGTKRWQFIRGIGFCCFVGSLLLLPYSVSGSLLHFNPPVFFVASLIVAVLAMVVLYYKNVRALHISTGWWAGWLCCLAIAVSLQLTVVFDVV